MTAPSRRERLKPIEYIAFAGAIGLFTGLIILLVTRDGLLPWIFGGVGFIVAIVTIATLSLAVRPNDDRLPKAGETPKADDAVEGDEQS